MRHMVTNLGKAVRDQMTRRKTKRPTCSTIN